MTLSIIIPVYNTNPDFLKNLFESIEKALSHYEISKRIEVLVIDDGSNCPHTIEFLNKEIKGIFDYELFRTTNKGRSHARNLGVKKSKGDYIAFLDSDDQIELNYFQEIISAIDKNQYDFISFAYQINKLKIYRTYNPLTFKDKIYENQKYFSICSSVYKRDFLKKNKITFNILLNSGEDIEFNSKCLAQASKSIHVNKVIFQYNYDFKSHRAEPYIKKILRPAYYALKYSINRIFKSKKITVNV